MVLWMNSSCCHLDLEFPLKGPCGPQAASLLEGSGTSERWGFVEGIGHWGCVWAGDIRTLTLPVLLPGYHEMNSPPLPCVPVMFCLTTDPKQQSQVAMS
jgi:hypothetical protein